MKEHHFVYILNQKQHEKQIVKLKNINKYKSQHNIQQKKETTTKM